MSIFFVKKIQPKLYTEAKLRITCDTTKRALQASIYEKKEESKEIGKLFEET